MRQSRSAWKAAEPLGTIGRYQSEIGNQHVFTGIIEELGRVRGVGRWRKRDITIERARHSRHKEWCSILYGVFRTALDIRQSPLRGCFARTLDRYTLGRLQPGSAVNLDVRYTITRSAVISSGALRARKFVSVADPRVMDGPY